MFDWWNQTVTIYHKIKDKDGNGRTVTKWERTIVDNCFFGNKTVQMLDGTAIVNKSQRFIRIPKLSFLICADDIAILGEITVDVPDNTDARKLLDSHDGFVISTVKNNALPHFPLPHIYIGE